MLSFRHSVLSTHCESIKISLIREKMVFICTFATEDGTCGYQNERIDLYNRHVAEKHNKKKTKCGLCDSFVTESNLARHKKTPKCRNSRNSLNDNSMTHDSDGTESDVQSIPGVQQQKVQMKVYLVTRKDESVTILHDAIKLGDIPLVLEGKKLRLKSLQVNYE